MQTVNSGVRGPKNRIKKSIFIASVFPVIEIHEIKDKINQINKEFSKASHNAFAYRILENGIVKSNFSDDGELRGTAGEMILSLLERFDIINSIVFVTRFYGGINLGRGGLIKAYSSTAQDLIQNVKLVEVS